MQDRLAIVAVHPGEEALLQQEGGGVLQEGCPDTARKLLEKERPQLGADGAEQMREIDYF